MLGRYDASYGALLRGTGDGHFDAVDMTSSTLMIDGQVRRIKALRSALGGEVMAVARNDETLLILRPVGARANGRAEAGVR
jgi:hypothetical protein